MRIECTKAVDGEISLPPLPQDRGVHPDRQPRRLADAGILQVDSASAENISGPAGLL